jgi:hypothetical protein
MAIDSTSETTSGGEAKSENRTEETAVAANEPKKLRILSIDGVGVRGIIPATILEYLEKELQVK